LERGKQVNKNEMHEMKWIRSWTHAHGMSSEGEREDRLIVPELLSELALNNIGKPGQWVPVVNSRSCRTANPFFSQVESV
jgi:hypothetical protein